MKYHILPPSKLSAHVTLPASKSISNRALVLNALSGATMSYLSNVSDCDDTTVMMETFFLLDAERREGRIGVLLPTVNIKAAGTAMRFLTAYLSAMPDGATRTITGTERMCHRPIGVLVDALRSMGAQIEYAGNEGFPPLRITGQRLTGGEVTLPGDISSQFVSALLMIAPQLTEGLTLHLKGNIVSRPYINMTLAMMREHGAKASWRGRQTIVVTPDHPYRPTPYQIESDWSAASYWYEIALLQPRPQSPIALNGLFSKSLQGDSDVADMFKELALQTFHTSEAFLCKTTVLNRGRAKRHVEWDFTRTPDLAQTMVVACAMKDISFVFSGLQSLRIKETDRIAALQTELRKLGVQVEVEGDSIMRWAGSKAQAPGDVPYLQPMAGTAIDTYEDHRMAMAFAPAAMVLGSIDINNPEVVSKSYPRYWDNLREAGFEIIIE